MMNKDIQNHGREKPEAKIKLKIKSLTWLPINKHKRVDWMVEKNLILCFVIVSTYFTDLAKKTSTFSLSG